MDSGSVMISRELTENETVNFQLEWTIAKFSLHKDSEDVMYCAGTTMADLGVTDYNGRFRIYVTPCHKIGDTDKELKYVSASLCLTDTPVESRTYTGSHTITTNFEMRLFSGTEREEISIEEQDDDQNPIPTFSEEAQAYGYEKLISHRLLFHGTDSKVAPIKDDCITVSVDATLYLKPKTICVPNTTASSDLPRRHREFIQRQLIWFESENCRNSTDFVFRSMDGQEFNISRFLLMAQSPVFAMLTRDTAEKQSSCCELTDVDGECAEILSAYISGCHTGEIKGNNAEKVLVMADKYQLMDLRSVCKHILAENVTVGNAVHLLILARQRELTTLKEAALRLIPKHMGAVLMDEFRGGAGRPWPPPSRYAIGWVRRNSTEGGTLLFEEPGPSLKTGLNSSLAVLSDAALEEMVASDPEAMQMIMEYCSKKVR